MTAEEMVNDTMVAKTVSIDVLQVVGSIEIRSAPFVTQSRRRALDVQLTGEKDATWQDLLGKVVETRTDTRTEGGKEMEETRMRKERERESDQKELSSRSSSGPQLEVRASKILALNENRRVHQMRHIHHFQTSVASEFCGPLIALVPLLQPSLSKSAALRPSEPLQARARVHPTNSPNAFCRDRNHYTCQVCSLTRSNYFVL